MTRLFMQRGSQSLTKIIKTKKILKMMPKPRLVLPQVAPVMIALETVTQNLSRISFGTDPAYSGVDPA